MRGPLEFNRPSSGALSNSPLNAGIKLAMVTGIAMQINDGINRNSINFGVVTFPPIQSMVVVTSPIGDHAPPAFAAIIISPAYHTRSLLLESNFRSMVINTIVAVRLSMMAGKDKGQYSHDPKEIFLFIGLNKSFNGRETIEVINDFYNSHGSNQKDEDFASFSKVVQ